MLLAVVPLARSARSMSIGVDAMAMYSWRERILRRRGTFVHGGVGNGGWRDEVGALSRDGELE